MHFDERFQTVAGVCDLKWLLVFKSHKIYAKIDYRLTYITNLKFLCSSTKFQ